VREAPQRQRLAPFRDLFRAKLPEPGRASISTPTNAAIAPVVAMIRMRIRLISIPRAETAAGFAPSA